MTRVAEWPTTRFTLWFLMSVAAICYPLGFLVDNFYFIITWSTLLLAWPIWEDHSKLKREARLAKYRADRDVWERQLRLVWTTNRVEYLITPDWML